MKKKKGKFEKKLKAYSAVAAGTLLLAPSANAAVQYSGPQNLVVNSNTQPVLIDMNGDGINDFSFFQYFSQYYTTTSSYRIGIATTNNGTLGGWGFINTSTPNMDVANLPSGYLIQSSLVQTPTYYWQYSFNEPLAGYGSTDGNFNYAGAQGYIGVHFDSAAPCTHHLGWIRWRTDDPAAQGTIIDWAYDDTCAPILAGDTVGAPAVSVPTLNQWGLFALIALLAGAGVMMLRKQEQV